MLTIDDANTILEKYGKCGFWHKIETSKLDVTSTSSFQVWANGFKLWFWPHGDYFNLEIAPSPSVATMIPYLEYADGTIGIREMTILNNELRIANIDCTDFIENPFDINVYITANSPGVYPPEENNRLWQWVFIPQSETVIPMINGEYDDKFYIIPLGPSITQYIIDGTVVTLEEDENGKFLRLPPHDCSIGVKDLYHRNLPLFNITFREFKTLPIPYIPSLYRGTPQTIQVINSDTEEPITEFQAYYQGRLLQGNQITLPYDADDYVDIVVDLNDPNYPNSTLKLKAPTMIYQANTKSEVKTAIENGIQTLQVGDNETKVSLNDMELTNIALINSNIQLTECTLTDCRIINTQYTDNGRNTFNNVTIETSTITNATSSTNYENCIINKSTLHNTELHITGILTENTFTNSLIISDGVITIQDNTFNGIGYKPYFPSYLYLTGEYTTLGNTFNLTGEWSELAYNMCIIKATNDFNQSVFINNNTFNLNITYDDEPTNTLYYNIVDDDKIRAVRLQ